MVISPAAKGLTTGEVQVHLAEVHGAEASRQTIPTITDKVLENMAEWQSRPLHAVCPVVFIDAIHVQIRDGAGLASLVSGRAHRLRLRGLVIASRRARSCSGVASARASSASPQRAVRSVRAGRSPSMQIR